MNDSARKAKDARLKKGRYELEQLLNSQGYRVLDPERDIGLISVDIVAKDEERNSFIFIEVIRARSPDGTTVAPDISRLKQYRFKEAATSHYRRVNSRKIPTFYELISIYALDDGNVLVRHYVDTLMCENEICNTLTLLESDTIHVSSEKKEERQ